MARINTQRSRKERTCGKCGGGIVPGDMYRYHKPRYGVKKTRCMKSTCAFRQSELTGSDKLATLYGIQEAIEDTIAEGDLEGVRDELQTCAEQAREVKEEYETSSQNIEDGFQHETEQSRELAEKGEQVEGWADRLEEVGQTLSEALDDVEEHNDEKATLQDELEGLQAQDEAGDADEDGERGERISTINDRMAEIDEHIETATSEAFDEAEGVKDELAI